MGREHIVKSYDENLEALSTMVTELGSAAGKQIEDAATALKSADSMLAAEVIRNDERINRQQIAAEELVIRLLATRQPMAVDLRAIVSALKISSELERIADYAANIVKYVGGPQINSDQGLIHSIARMAAIGQGMLEDIITAYRELDVDKAIEVWHRDDEIDDIYVDVIGKIHAELERGQGKKTKDYSNLIFAARCCERIGDHITNVAENIYYIKHGELYIDGAVSA